MHRCGERSWCRCRHSLTTSASSSLTSATSCNWRYFMWNFAGRQNDIQGNGEPEHGNWITGFSFIDDSLDGDQNPCQMICEGEQGPQCILLHAADSRALMTFLASPDPQEEGNEERQGRGSAPPYRNPAFSWIVFFLFFSARSGHRHHLNQTPTQPRERDYGYAGQFPRIRYLGATYSPIIDILKCKMKLSGTAVTAISSSYHTSRTIQMAS